MSTGSVAPLATSAKPEDFSADGPVQRRGLTNFSTGTGMDTLKSDPAPSSKEGQNFTAGGQLKATLLSSWINVLLIAAPVGSKSPKLLLLNSKAFYLANLP